MQVYLIAALLFALLVAAFAVQNATVVDIRCLFWNIDRVPLSLVILISVASGAIIVFVFGLFRQLKMSMQIRELNFKLRALQPRESQAPEAGPPADECQDPKPKGGP